MYKLIITVISLVLLLNGCLYSEKQLISVENSIDPFKLGKYIEFCQIDDEDTCFVIENFRANDYRTFGDNSGIYLRVELATRGDKMNRGIDHYNLSMGPMEFTTGSNGIRGFMILTLTDWKKQQINVRYIVKNFTKIDNTTMLGTYMAAGLSHIETRSYHYPNVITLKQANKWLSKQNKDK